LADKNFKVKNKLVIAGLTNANGVLQPKIMLLIPTQIYQHNMAEQEQQPLLMLAKFYIQLLALHMPQLL